ncbi:MAG: hypothetical protein F2799_01915 [Actinobacteria bacterium]|uniref:Unannotated protein n=1 Tax=freshwater metagenome TaxID=449393 RepID=A0A6J7D0W3_9ZZZZ|nr:hypothetical protein [Actinomycetota bacterium]
MRTRTFRKFSLVLAAVLSFSALGAVGATPASADTATWLGQSGGGQVHECAVRTDGRVKCWGYDNPSGYLGGPRDLAAYPFTVNFVTGITTATKVAVGGYNTCILLADTTVKCMGDNTAGQIGDGTNIARNNTPTTVTGLSGVKDVVTGGSVSGDQHACALLLDGNVKCWGANRYGQLGDGTSTDRWVPVSVSGVTNAVSIATTDQTVCAALATGAVKCWGYGGLGLLGNGNGAYTTANYSRTPVTANGVTNAVSVATDWVNRTVCATTTIGEAYCWGGVASSVPGFNGPGPVKITGVTGAKQFIPGGCWITSTNTVKCFSKLNNYGELGAGAVCQPWPGVTCPATNAPGAVVPSLSNVVQLSGFDSRQYCARLADGSIYCWGDNIYGIVANKSAPTPSGSIQDRQVPTPLRIFELSAPPVITSAPATPSNATSGTVSFSADAAATAECKVGTGAWTACTSPYSYSGLAGGSHTFSVRTTETGASASPEVSTTFAIDITAPVAPTISAGPLANNIAINTTSGSLTFTGESGARLECHLDSGAWATCTSPFAFSGLADGAHTFGVRAIDAVGNVGAVTTRSWTVDTTVAPPVITQKPPVLGPGGVAQFRFTGEAVSSYQCSIDNGVTYQACGTNTSNYWMNYYFNGTGGTYTFLVKQKDQAGNVSEPASWTFTLDSLAPVAPVITSGPDAVTSSTTATFTFTGEEGATFECHVDGGQYSPGTACTSPVTYSNVRPGFHTFYVTQKDAAGNIGWTAASRSWTVGSVNPPLISSVPIGTVGDTSASVLFSIGAGNTAICSVDGAAYAPCTSPLALTGLADGVHRVQIKQVSPTLGTSNPVTASWTVDNTAPLEPHVTKVPADPSNSSSASIEFTGEAGSTFECQLDGGTWGACTSPFTTSGLSEGDHNMKVRAIDAVGHESPESEVDWIVDLTAPDAPAITAHPATLANSATADFSFTPEEGATTECQIDGGVWTACTAPASYSGLTDGDHTFSVRQTDAAGNVSDQSDFAWAVDTTAPAAATITSPADGSTTASNAVTFDQVEGLTYKCQINTGDIVDCTSPLDLSNTQDGEVTVKIWAVDPAGNESPLSEVAFTLDTTAPAAPMIGGIPGNGTTDYTASLTLDGAGEGEEYQCSINGGAWATCASPLELSGLTDGPQSVKVRIVDAAGNVGAETEAKWSIGLFVTDPVVTSPASGDVTADSAIEFTVQADTTTTCSLDGSPPFACSSPYDTSGLPEGVHTLDITSTDADGHYATTHFEWTIDRSAPGTPEIANVPPSGTPDPTAVLDLNGANPGDTYECSVNGADYATCADPLNLSGLGDGLNTVTARLKDQAGNIGQPSQAMWLIGDKMVMPPAGETGTMTLSGPASFNFGSPAVQTFGLSTFSFNTAWPAGARTVVVSNSRTFANSKHFPVYSTSPWGNPVAKPGTFGSRTVYFKYIGSGIDQTQVYTTTYRWDRAAPYVVMAARKHLLGYKPDAWKVRLTGKDRGPAGIDKVQFWMRKDKMPKAAPIQGAWHSGYVTNWAPVVTVPGGFQPNWVRASDQAGNWSRWYLIK